MKRLLIIHDSMGGGGAERVLVTLLNALDPVQYEITLLLIYKEGPFFLSIPAHVTVKWLFKKYSSLPTRIVTHFYRVRNFIRGKLARRLLGQDKFDVTISFMEGAPAKLHSLLMDLAPRNLTWVHCNQSIGRWYNFWFKVDEEKEFYKRVDKIAFVSNELRSVFEKEFQTDAQKTVIYNPIDINEINTAAKEIIERQSDVFSIINVGRLVPQKNHKLLIDVALILKNNGRKFLINIFGKGLLYDELGEYVKSLGLEKVVIFKGFVNNPFPYIHQSDLFCLTSIWEGCPMVIAEAMSLGIPIVTTPIGAVGEMLEGGGGYITNGTAEEIASKIEFLMDNQQQRLAIGLDGKSNALKFDINNVVNSVTAFINKE